MAHTHPLPWKRIQEQEEYSLPYPLTHKPLNRSQLPPLPVNRQNQHEQDYVPEEALTASESSLEQSNSFSTFSRSSYDPLENMEEYLRMRDQL